MRRYIGRGQIKQAQASWACALGRDPGENRGRLLLREREGFGRGSWPELRGATGKTEPTGGARAVSNGASALRGAWAERRAGEPAEAGAGRGEREKGGEGLGRFGLMGWRESGRESGQTGQLGRFAGLGR